MDIKHFIKSCIGHEHTQRIANARRHLFGGFWRKTYSDSGEDIVLTGRIFPGQREGFYVDVGAFHPSLSSNTRLLYELGWRGINIDPNPESIRAFERFRPRDINVRAGVGLERGTRPYYRFSHAGANTFSREMMEKKRAEPWMTYLGEEAVDVVPLADILATHLPSGASIDLLDIDVEGLDYDVLRSNNWELYRPRAIVIEDRTFVASKPHENAIFQFLTDRGYELRSFVGITLIFVYKGGAVS